MSTFSELQASIPWLKLSPDDWSQTPQGGWVERYARVFDRASVSGDASVSDDASVSGDASVFDRASVSGDASVFGTASVFGDASVFGTARVSGDARVSGGEWPFSPLQIQGSRHFLTTCSHTEISIGCEVHTPAWWAQHFRAVGRREGYSPAEIEEYKLLIDLATAWLKLKFPEENP